ncbi:MAG: chemotaxis protein CheW [bacterium]
MNQSSFTLTVEEIRKEFDRAFIYPELNEKKEERDFLSIRIQKDLFAVPVMEIKGVQKCPRVTPVVSPNPALLGIGMIQGNLIALYRLGAFVSVSDQPGSPVWVLLAGDGSIGFVFDELHGYLRIPADEMRAAKDASPSSFIVGAFEHSGDSHTVLNLPNLVQAVFSRKTIHVG